MFFREDAGFPTAFPGSAFRSLRLERSPALTSKGFSIWIRGARFCGGESDLGMRPSQTNLPNRQTARVRHGRSLLFEIGYARLLRVAQIQRAVEIRDPYRNVAFSKYFPYGARLRSDNHCGNLLRRSGFD